MDLNAYRVELENAERALAPIAERTRISGDGVAQFLSASRKNRAVELYRGPSNFIFIDRALDDELLGEESFRSFASALEAANRWLVDA